MGPMVHIQFVSRELSPTKAKTMTNPITTKPETIDAYLGTDRELWITEGETPESVAAALVTGHCPAHGRTAEWTREVLVEAIEDYLDEDIAEVKIDTECAAQQFWDSIPAPLSKLVDADDWTTITRGELRLIRAIPGWVSDAPKYAPHPLLVRDLDD